MSIEGEDEDFLEFRRLQEIQSSLHSTQDKNVESGGKSDAPNLGGPQEPVMIAEEKAPVYNSRPTSDSPQTEKEKTDPEAKKHSAGEDNEEKTERTVLPTNLSAQSLSWEGQEQAQDDDNIYSGHAIQGQTLSDYEVDILRPSIVDAKSKPYYSMAGRYHPHSAGDEAFLPITMTMAFNTDEGQNSRRPTVLIRRQTTAEEKTSPTPSPVDNERSISPRGGHEAKVTSSKRKKKSKMGEDEEAPKPDETKAQAAPIPSATMQSIVSIMKHLSLNQKEMPDADDEELLRLSTRAMMGLRRWKKRADTQIKKRAEPFITVKSFARNAQHYDYLQANIDKLATEMPYSMRATLYEEAFPILKDIVQAYERTLGKSNALTEQAKEKLVKLTVLMKTLDEM